MKYYVLYIFGLVTILFSSCDEIETPIPPPIVVEEGRVILIEELTGVSCTPCAAASAILEGIIDGADGAVVAYGIHGSFQSEPLSASKYDFRNEDAAELERYLVEFGKPAASMNRTISNTGSLVYAQPASWQAPVDAELEKPRVANVVIRSTYNESTRRADIEVDVNALLDIEGALNLVVAISESNLIDPQKAPGEDIIDFKHKHVLKEHLTTFLGDPIASAGLAAGEAIDTRNFSYTLPDELNGEWLPENMEITAFITAENLNGEVQQAAQVNLVQ